MFDVLLSIAISFTITYLAIPAIIRVAESKKLYDVPNERKIHKSLITSLGGLGIFAGFILACLLGISFSTAPEFQYFLAAVVVLFFLGLKDDILIISPLKKFIGQVIAAFLIINKGGIHLKSMYGFMGIHEVPEMFGLLLTYFTVIVIINSFNLIDGVDGLAGTLGIIAASLFGFYFLQTGMAAYAILAFSLAGGLAAFLIFNYHPAKIFMGDTGSMLIGVVNAILVLKFIEIAPGAQVAMPVSAAPAIGFAVLLVPLMDTLRVFGIRIFHQRSPFSPDRNHIHHLMLDRGWSHNTVTFSLAGFSLSFAFLAFFVRSIGCTWLVFASACIFFTGIATLYYTRRQPRLFVARSLGKNETEPQVVSKIVTLTKDIVLEQKN